MLTMDLHEKNLAATIIENLPKPQVAHTQACDHTGEDEAIVHVAVPHGYNLTVIDGEKLRPNPRRKVATASLAEPDDFIRYVDRHATEDTLVWCAFNPETYALKFTGVIDEHGSLIPGWRSHQAVFEPAMAVEWKTWTQHDRKPMTQVEFALFLEQNADDVAAVDGYPNNTQMLEMAVAFEARQDQAFKSAVRLQSGGVDMSFINTDDAQTVERMKVFDKFMIGLPVFRGVKDADGKPMGYLIEARLRYRQQQGKVVFWYELIRPDRAHERAANELIAKVKDGIGDVPLLQGGCR